MKATSKDLLGILIGIVLSILVLYIIYLFITAVAT